MLARFVTQSWHASMKCFPLNVEADSTISMLSALNRIATHVALSVLTITASIATVYLGAILGSVEGMIDSTLAISSSSGIKPTLRLITPSVLTNSRVGIELTPYCFAMPGHLSTLTEINLTLPLYLSATLWKMGESSLHGGHHSAQKSTTTGAG